MSAVAGIDSERCGAAGDRSGGQRSRLAREFAAPRLPGLIDLQLRELTPSDRRALRFMFDRLSPSSRQQRFLHAKNELSVRELEELTRLDHWHHEALIAWSLVPRVPIGVGRYVRGDEFDIAEVAITVIDEWQRRGVGRQLLFELRDRARRAGIRRFSALMLRSNKGALRLAHELGPCRLVRSSDGIVQLECWCE